MKRKNDDTKKSNDTETFFGTPKKIVLIGDGCIGKSTFFNKLINLNNDNYRFPKKYQATDNFDFDRVNLKTNIGTTIIDLWDTAGQENRGGKLRDAYIKGADGILLLYDVSEKRTIDNVPKWLEQIKSVCSNVPVAVIGNKSDKFDNLQQSEIVKIRECNLQRDVGHKNIKNFLISIKEDTHLEFQSNFWSSIVNIKEESSCLIGLEYLLSNIYAQTVICNN
jgi:small GTP-binding protein